MGIMDARGHVRPGMFEKVYDAETDTTFMPMSGEGARMTFRATGPNVTGDGIVEARRWFSPRDLAVNAIEQGVLSRPPVILGLMPVGFTKGRNRK